MAEEKETRVKESPSEETVSKVEAPKEAEKEKSKESVVDAEVVKEEREAKEERPGIVYIYSSKNNTIIHITDLAGNTISRVSGGMITKHSRLKADPTIAMFAAKKAAERARDLGITSLYARMRAKTNSPGMGSSVHAAVKSLDKEGFKIISILDTTKVPRGGPKIKGGKRGRRV